MSCNHSIWNNKCEYCGIPSCQLGKSSHFIWDNKCEYCGIPSCQLGKSSHSIWNNKCEYCGIPSCQLGKSSHSIWDGKCDYSGIPSCQLGNSYNNHCNCQNCRNRDYLLSKKIYSEMKSENFTKSENESENSDFCILF